LHKNRVLTNIGHIGLDNFASVSAIIKAKFLYNKVLLFILGKRENKLCMDMYFLFSN